MEKVVVNRERCKGCGLCLHACAFSLLQFSAKANAKGYYPPKMTDESRCTSCAACARICPDTAVSVYRPQ
ncbi:ATP-binding protein [Salisediminibacterium halotolerans]|uniref:2-oxoglutarate ferredoxin oxidoreductase subunit delta n=1 Tax=Salisediminibacterium halotolerans TaxID=517425 RepID=A0A1H9P6S7_9BACI|nr:2-oxoglutarate ferredoxin oxidoreductase subunit delta [Salisediminibacterium haloalkalitolerans]